MRVSAARKMREEQEKNYKKLLKFEFENGDLAGGKKEEKKEKEKKRENKRENKREERNGEGRERRRKRGERVGAAIGGRNKKNARRIGKKYKKNIKI